MSASNRVSSASFGSMFGQWHAMAGRFYRAPGTDSEGRGHRKVNESSTPLHFSRAPASSAINNCPPLIARVLLSAAVAPVALSLSPNALVASSTNIRQRREKLFRILGFPSLPFPRSSIDKHESAVKEQRSASRRISIRDFALNGRTVRGSNGVRDSSFGSFRLRGYVRS